jgi:hypothetical protein
MLWYECLKKIMLVHFQVLSRLCCSFQGVLQNISIQVYTFDYKLNQSNKSQLGISPLLSL